MKSPGINTDGLLIENERQRYRFEKKSIDKVSVGFETRLIECLLRLSWGKWVTSCPSVRPRFRCCRPRGGGTGGAGGGARSGELRRPPSAETTRWSDTSNRRTSSPAISVCPAGPQSEQMNSNTTKFLIHFGFYSPQGVHEESTIIGCI